MSVLYHTTSWSALPSILKMGKLLPGSSVDDYNFVSLSEKPLLRGDIAGTDVVLVYPRSRLSREFFKVDYTRRWAHKWPDHANYIAGSGWSEMFQFEPGECVDEEGWVDEECEERVRAEALIDSFTLKRDEREWISKKADTPIVVGQPQAILVRRRDRKTLERLLDGTEIPVLEVSGSVSPGEELTRDELLSYTRELYASLHPFVTAVRELPQGKAWGLDKTIENGLRHNKLWQDLQPVLTTRSRDRIARNIRTGFHLKALVRTAQAERVVHTEAGHTFETGRFMDRPFPVTWRKQKTPDFGSRFGQDIEPHGRYVSFGHNGKAGKTVEPGGFKVETLHLLAHFKKPLVIRTTGVSWKRDLANEFKRKGKALSKALLREGYDGIVTIDGRWVSEIVDLTAFRPTRTSEVAPRVAQARTTTWRDFPDLRGDGFVAYEVGQLGIPSDPYVPSDLKVDVTSVPISAAWRMLRKVFKGKDKNGMPVDLEGESHWDERGPQHVQDLVRYIQSKGNRWPFEPVVVVNGELVDGRHRLFAAKLSGTIKSIPVINLDQYKR